MNKQMAKRVGRLTSRMDHHRVGQFGRRLAGLSWDAAWERFTEALVPESIPVVDAIIDQVDRTTGNSPHAFIQWFEGLRAGWCTLPEQIPPAVLIAYRDWPSPIPMWRCEDCHMALPHHTVEYQFRPCPICGCDRLFYSDLSRPWGERWIDPKATWQPRMGA
jgi:hypothetical protein